MHEERTSQELSRLVGLTIAAARIVGKTGPLGTSPTMFEGSTRLILEFENGLCAEFDALSNGVGADVEL